MHLWHTAINILELTSNRCARRHDTLNKHGRTALTLSTCKVYLLHCYHLIYTVSESSWYCQLSCFSLVTYGLWWLSYRLWHMVYATALPLMNILHTRSYHPSGSPHYLWTTKRRESNVQVHIMTLLLALIIVHILHCLQSNECNWQLLQSWN